LHVNSIHGVVDFCTIIMDAGHEEHALILECVGREFHTGKRDCSEVVFDDPAERLKNMEVDF